MSEAFDPYHEWLGISPRDQPPNHYRLLGIDVFEASPTVVEHAADQRMAHVRSFQTGGHSALSQKILNEISAARVCLLNPEKKAEYDNGLRRQSATAIASSQPPAPTPSANSVSPPVTMPPARTSTPLPLPKQEDLSPSIHVPRRSKQSRQLLAVIGVTATLLLGIVAVYLSGSGLEEVVQVEPDTEPTVEQDDKSTEPSGSGMDTAPAPKEPEGRDQKNDKPDEGPAPGDESDPTTPTVPQSSGPIPRNPPQVEPRKVPVPDGKAREQAEQRLKELLADTSATRLFDAALAPDRTPTERFVLLQESRDKAVAAGDVETAFGVVEETSTRYEIDLLEMKVETLAGLRKTTNDYQVVAKRGLQLAREAVSGSNPELARRCAFLALSAARKADDDELVTEITLQLLKLPDPPPP